MVETDSDLERLKAAEAEARRAASEAEARAYLRHGAAKQPAADLAARQFGRIREGVQEIPAGWAD